MIWQVLLDKARQWPQGALPLWVEVRWLGARVERPVAFRNSGIFYETYFVTDIREFEGRALCRYEGLRRPCPLMSETEKRLSPTRFPA